MFTRLLASLIRDGSLRVIDGAGRSRLLGDGGPPAATIRIRSRRADIAIALNPGLRVGEAFMDGTLTIEDGSLYDALAVIARNFDRIGTHPWLGAIERAQSRLKQRNPRARARQNVAHHYDLSGALYDLFLDRDRQYSCAYFTRGDETLDAAQDDKKRHIAAKLLLDRPGLSVLDIGSGWGGLGLYLAARTGAQVTGVTLSAEQHRISEERAAAAGMSGQARFHLRDYRELTGRFDRIVSVGMFEHVGKRHYDEFFARIRDRLTDDGVALIHSIGYSDAPAPINPFIRKYIFPGADLPSLSEVFAAVERSGLIVTDVEILRLQYAETLRHWRERFMARRDAAEALYDARFVRMWEFYLALCEVGFRYRTNMVFQVQLARQQEAVPLTRDYMLRGERALAWSGPEPVSLGRKLG
ncbi:MAG TPA: cyclopropane-fatty-acyl-phospholipid synthase family protein [Acetobacteraceae bacterium]|nr:cyclopropane-fatty-acyl-phospholipid synthase family protein [Acetobacteraceae bacterium]